MLRVEYAHWGQSPEDLRRLAMSAPHARTRERALALYEIAQGSCATRVAGRTGRHPQTVMGWVHAYNAQGPDALGFRRTGGRPPFALRWRRRFHRRPTPLCAQMAAALRDAVCAVQRTAATPPREGADPGPRGTLKGLMLFVGERFGCLCCRETLRAALHRRKLSWKKAKKLLGRADPEQRQAFVEQLQGVLDGAQHDRHLLVYVDEAHIHQDADLGYGWAERGQRFWVASRSPGLSARVSFYGLYLYNEGQVRLWPSPRANGEHTIEVLGRLRAAFPNEALIVLC